MSHIQYSEGDLVIGKLGTNPWWPGTVLMCPKTNKYFLEIDNNRQVYIKFFELNVESWIEVGNILTCSSRSDMEIYLSEAQKTSSHVKFQNHIPDAMIDLYNKTWKMYDKLQMKYLYHKDKPNESNQMMGKAITVEEFNQKNNSKPCEICLMKEIEFDSSDKNKRILSMDLESRRKYFSNLMINNAVETEKKCTNYCVWKYHNRCVESENDMLCSCNKSVWLCGICDQVISVSQLFVCDKHECMRPYHRSCLGPHFEMCPDMKQCPMHHCINCALDFMTCEDDTQSPANNLVSCVKCKIAFHDDANCLPTSFISITDKLIICYRHLVDIGNLASNVSGFCFTCGSQVGGQEAVSCRYCMVTYHSTGLCLPGWIELTDDSKFVCNGCRFPYARRRTGHVLSLPRDVEVPYNVNSWKIGLSHDYNNCANSLISIRDEDNNEFLSTVTRTISINLQSLDHLVCFGLFRFRDMQKCLKHLSVLSCSIRHSMKMRQTFYRNAFVLQFAGLFPVNENLYSSLPPKADEATTVAVVGRVVEKCSCTDSCTTRRCTNVAANTECTADTCVAISRCRNRRLQRRQYPRYRLVVEHASDGMAGTCSVVLEEAVVKDILVMELVGQVKEASWEDMSLDQSPHAGVVQLSDTSMIDCSQFCSLSRFVGQSDRPNLQMRSVTVAGVPRIGLFSTRRIIKGEQLSLDKAAGMATGRMALVSWHDVVTDVDMTGDRSPTSVPLSPPLRLEEVGPAQVLLDSMDMTEQDDTPTDTPKQLPSPPPITQRPQVIDLCTDEHNATDDSIIVYSRVPLCPSCLQELVGPSSRVLVHCMSCFSIFHPKCAQATLNMAYPTSKTQCSPDVDLRVLTFRCQPCRTLGQ